MTGRRFAQLTDPATHRRAVRLIGPEAELGFLEEVFANEPASALAGTLLAHRLIDEGWKIRTTSRAKYVRYAECAAAMAWPDGARQLIGVDGITVRIEPTLFEVHPGAIARIDAGVSPANVVWMPARDPSAIPQPKPPAAGR